MLAQHVGGVTVILVKRGIGNQPVQLHQAPLGRFDSVEHPHFPLGRRKPNKLPIKPPAICANCATESVRSEFTISWVR